VTVSRIVRAVALFLAFSFGARAQTIDPTIGRRLVFGPSQGPAPMFRLDIGRSGQSSLALPRAPKLLRRIRIPGGFLHGITVPEPSRILIAHKTAQLSELDEQGKSIWTVKTGAAASQTLPVVTNDGTRLLVNAAGEVIAVGRDGRLRYRRALQKRQNVRAAAPLPLDDGNVIIALGALLVRLAPDGAELSRIEAPGSVTALAHDGTALYAATESGRIFEWTQLGTLTPRGDFGGRVDDTLTVLPRRRLAAVVDRERLVELDLTSRTTQAYPLGGSSTWVSAPAAARDGRLLVTTADGFFFAYRDARREALRVPLDPLLGASAATGQRSGPAPVVDATGSVAVILSGIDPAIIDRDGTVRFVSGAACADPVSLVPLSSRQLVAGCSSGMLWVIGEARP
jgi:hypothetical protein